MEENIITLANEKKYTDFSDSVKSTLKSKLANHEVVSDYTDNLEKIAELKSALVDINTSGE